MKEVQALLMDPTYTSYLRMHPNWYLLLNHDPKKVHAFKQCFKKECKESFNDKLDKICFILEMIKMMM